MDSVFVVTPRSWLTKILQPFRRVTSSGLVIPEIDGLRFIAIASVFIYHLSGDILRHAPREYVASVTRSSGFFWFTQRLDFGVPLFFVISGFILALPFAQHYLQGKGRVCLGRYYLRRVTRLEPPYILSLLIMFLLKALNDGSFSKLTPHLFASLLYAHNLAFAGPSLINVVAWSLEIEIQFYIIAPLLAIIFRLPAGKRRIMMVASCIAAPLFPFLLPFPHILHLTLLGYLQYFLAGFLLADLYLTQECSGWNFDAISAIGWPVLAVMLAFPAALPFFSPFLVAILYLAALNGKFSSRVASTPLLATIGGMCYSIYLIHNYAIAAVGKISEHIVLSDYFPVRLATQVALVAPPVLLLSVAYFRLIEKPCMQLRVAFPSGRARIAANPLDSATAVALLRPESPSQ